MPGQAPGAGVDIEPLRTDNTWYGVTFEDCEFINNHGSSFSNGSPRRTSSGRGLVVDAHADGAYFRIINSRFSGNRSEALKINLRKGADLRHFEFRNLVISDNGRDEINLDDREGNHDSAFVNGTIANANVPSIIFDEAISASGNSVTIWKGSYDPNIHTNGRETMIIKYGTP